MGSMLSLSVGEIVPILQQWHQYNRDETWSKRGYDIGLQSMRIDILNTVREEMRDQVTVIISSLDNLMVVATLMLSIGFGFVVEGTFPPSEKDYEYDDVQKPFLVVYAILCALSLVFPLACLMLTIAARFEVELCQQDVMGDLQKHLLKALQKDQSDLLDDALARQEQEDRLRRAEDEGKAKELQQAEDEETAKEFQRAEDEKTAKELEQAEEEGVIAMMEEELVVQDAMEKDYEQEARNKLEKEMAKDEAMERDPQEGDGRKTGKDMIYVTGIEKIKVTVFLCVRSHNPDARKKKKVSDAVIVAAKADVETVVVSKADTEIGVIVAESQFLGGGTGTEDKSKGTGKGSNTKKQKERRREFEAACATRSESEAEMHGYDEYDNQKERDRKQQAARRKYVEDDVDDLPDFGDDEDVKPEASSSSSGARQEQQDLQLEMLKEQARAGARARVTSQTAYQTSMATKAETAEESKGRIRLLLAKSYDKDMSEAFEAAKQRTDEKDEKKRKMKEGEEKGEDNEPKKAKKDDEEAKKAKKDDEEAKKAKKDEEKTGSSCYSFIFVWADAYARAPSDCTRARGRSAPPVGQRGDKSPGASLRDAVHSGLKRQLGTLMSADHVGHIAEDEVRLIAEGLLQKVNHYHTLYPIAQLFLWLGMLSSVLLCSVLLGLYYQANYPNTPWMWRCYSGILVACAVISVFFLVWMKFRMLREPETKIHRKNSVDTSVGASMRDFADAAVGQEKTRQKDSRCYPHKTSERGAGHLSGPQERLRRPLLPELARRTSSSSWQHNLSPIASVTPVTAQAGSEVASDSELFFESAAEELDETDKKVTASFFAPLRKSFSQNV
ncbi:unnamed protein product [Polarella glacialis]|uniref:Uncharacterized protein n=1 Tax=Polarella glacialis TaxID=89957 RepID=A0A813KJ54_POLGL|nr:unnamed protein product [Polarella glacialis]